MSAGYSVVPLTRRREDGSTYRAWQIKWTDGSGSHRISLGTDDRPTAEASARAFWSARNIAATDSVGIIMDGYLDATSDARGNKREREAWKAAEGFWRGVRPGLVDAAMCRDYARQRNRAANTIRNEIAAIRSGMKWAKVAPAEALWLPPSPDSAVGHLTRAQFARFLAGARAPHIRLFIQLAIATAARSTALKSLKWERVDLDRRRIDLNPRGAVQVSNKRKAIVPINDQLHAVLVEARAAALTEYVIEYKRGPVAKVQNGFVAASVRSGVHCTPHMLRHSAAVWLAEDRTPMEEIARYLGHKNTAITSATYARFSPDYLQRAAASLTW
jgi:integrase